MTSTPNDPTLRSRTITWQAPGKQTRQAVPVSGLAYLQAIVDGKVAAPPVASLIGYRLAQVAPGMAVFELEPAEYHYNPSATVHGGVAATILDSAMTCAVLSHLEAGRSCSTLEIKVNYIRPITAATGPVRCEARAIHVGQTIATAEGQIRDAGGKLYAHAVTTCLVFDYALEKETRP